MTASLQEELPVGLRTPPENATRMALTSQLRTPLPSYFSDYVTKEINMLTSNLCSLKLNNQKIYTGMKCGKVLGGIMHKGFAQSIIFYNDLTNKYSYTPMSAFATTYKKGSLYPVFIELLYIRRSLYNLITDLEIEF